MAKSYTLKASKNRPPHTQQRFYMLQNSQTTGSHAERGNRKTKRMLEQLATLPAESVLGLVTSDEELKHYAEELRKPVVFDVADFGEFVLDRQVDWFTTQAIWVGKSVSLNLSESAAVPSAL